jgi:hypothetical protein
MADIDLNNFITEIITANFTTYAVIATYLFVPDTVKIMTAFFCTVDVVTKHSRLPTGPLIFAPERPQMSLILSYSYPLMDFG